MQFFHTLRESIHSPSFYLEVKSGSIGVALRHYSMLIVIVAVVATVSLYTSFGSWSSAVNGARDIERQIIDLYPPELEITFQNGRATSNVPEPYIIPVPAGFDMSESPANTHVPKNLIVINTTGTVSAADFKIYDTYAILGGDSIGFNDESKGKMEIRQLGQFSESFVLNKDRVIEIIAILAKYLKVLAIIMLFLLPVIIFGFIWVGFLAYLLFGAVIIWIVGKIRGMSLTYGEAYTLGLYLIAVPLLYQMVTGFFPILYLPYGFTILLAIMAAWNMMPAKESISPLATAPAAPVVPFPKETPSTPEPVGEDVSASKKE